jgi:hypothetical protein
MSASRPFAYNTGSPITGTEQVGDIAIGWPNAGFESTGLEWWNGPDEELGYVICKPISSDTQPTQFFSGNLQCSTTYKGVDINLSNSNQTAYQQFGYQMSVLCDTVLDSRSKVMFSVSVSLADPPALPGSHFVGIGTRSMFYQGNPYGAFPGNDVYSMGYGSDGNIWYNGVVYVPDLQSFGNGDIIDIAIDNTINGMWVRVNGGDWNDNPAEGPSTNAGSIEIIGGRFYPVLCPGYEGTMTIQNTATYGVPEGYTLLGGNLGASVGFSRSDALTEGSFISLVNSAFSQSFSTGADAKTWLNTNGYWTSYNDSVASVLSLDAADYSGTGPWIDSVGGKQFTLINSPSWRSNVVGGTFKFLSASSQYAICSSSLPSLNTWSVGVWHYYAGRESGSAPCIVTETFIGGSLNYSLGKNNGPFSSGFFDGGWRVTDGYPLTPNNWYYIIGTYDGSTIKLYVNNILVDSTNYTGTPTSSGAGIRLMERWDLSDYWEGYLSKVDIYDKALDTNEISSIWNSNKTRFGL